MDYLLIIFSILLIVCLPIFDLVILMIAGTTTIDILPKGITKGVTLKNVLKSRGYNHNDMIFIGDALYEGGNDYEVKREGLDTLPTTGPTQTEDLLKDLLNS